MSQRSGLQLAANVPKGPRWLAASNMGKPESQEPASGGNYWKISFSEGLGRLPVPPPCPARLIPQHLLSSIRSCCLSSQQHAWQALGTASPGSSTLIELCLRNSLRVLLKRGGDSSKEQGGSEPRRCAALLLMRGVGTEWIAGSVWGIDLARPSVS